jgi:hypothetical protein
MLGSLLTVLRPSHEVLASPLAYSCGSKPWSSSSSLCCARGLARPAASLSLSNAAHSSTARDPFRRWWSPPRDTTGGSPEPALAEVCVCVCQRTSFEIQWQHTALMPGHHSDAGGLLPHTGHNVGSTRACNSRAKHNVGVLMALASSGGLPEPAIAVPSTMWGSRGRGGGAPNPGTAPCFTARTPSGGFPDPALLDPGSVGGGQQVLSNAAHISTARAPFK